MPFWTQRVDGHLVDLEDPRLSDICIHHIAHAESLLCRYGGACLRFYSVAEHSVLAAEKAPDEFKLDTLLHDGTEAYVQDLTRNLKKLVGPAYAEVEDRFARLIAEKFGTRYPLPAEVKEIDNRIIADERQQNMNPAKLAWSPRVPLGVELKFWTPAKARYEFLAAFYRYGGRE